MIISISLSLSASLPHPLPSLTLSLLSLSLSLSPHYQVHITYFLCFPRTQAESRTLELTPSHRLLTLKRTATMWLPRSGKYDRRCRNCLLEKPGTCLWKEAAWPGSGERCHCWSSESRSGMAWSGATDRAFCSVHFELPLPDTAVTGTNVNVMIIISDTVFTLIECKLKNNCDFKFRAIFW